MKKSFIEFFDALLKVAISTIVICGLLTLIFMFVGAVVILIAIIAHGGVIT